MPQKNYHLHLKGVVGGSAKALPRFTLPATPHNNKVQQVARCSSWMSLYYVLFVATILTVGSTILGWSIAPHSSSSSSPKSIYPQHRWTPCVIFISWVRLLRCRVSSSVPCVISWSIGLQVATRITAPRYLILWTPCAPTPKSSHSGTLHPQQHSSHRPLLKIKKRVKGIGFRKKERVYPKINPLCYIKNQTR